MNDTTLQKVSKAKAARADTTTHHVLACAHTPKPCHQRTVQEVQETRTFADPCLPDLAMTVTLRALSGCPFERKCRKSGDKLVSRYVQGKQNGDGTREPIEPLFDSMGSSIRLSESLARIIGRLQVMQVSEGETPYQPHEWATIAERMPTAFRALMLWSDRLLKQTKDSVKQQAR